MSKESNLWSRYGTHTLSSLTLVYPVLTLLTLSAILSLIVHCCRIAVCCCHVVVCCCHVVICCCHIVVCCCCSLSFIVVAAIVATGIVAVAVVLFINGLGCWVGVSERVRWEVCELSLNTWHGCNDKKEIGYLVVENMNYGLKSYTIYPWK